MRVCFEYDKRFSRTELVKKTCSQIMPHQIITNGSVLTIALAAVGLHILMYALHNPQNENEENTWPSGGEAYI